MKVAVTGATGVVGRSVMWALLANGHDVRALVRSPEASADVAEAGAVPVHGDILDEPSLLDLVDGCQWVFNVAGVNEMCVDDATHMFAVNVDGVRNVMKACRDQGVARLIHTSSAVTIGESRGEVGTETSTHRGHFLSQYEESKFLGEIALFEEAGGLDVVAVNPSSVQGPGRATGTGKIILDVVNGDLGFMVDTRVSLVDIDDCARGHLLAAQSGRPGSRYVLSNRTVGVREALDMASEVLGVRVAPHFVPGALASALAGTAASVGRLLGRELPFCREMVRVMTFGHRYDGTRAATELGLTYTPIETTIARLLEWFRAEGLLQVGR